MRNKKFLKKIPAIVLAGTLVVSNMSILSVAAEVDGTGITNTMAVAETESDEVAVDEAESDAVVLDEIESDGAVVAENTTDESAEEEDVTDEIITALEVRSVISEDIKTISINMGSEKSEMIFTWLDTSNHTSYVKVTTPNGEVVARATQTDYTEEIGYYSYTATLDCFTEEYDYAYQVGNDVYGWSEVAYITINDAENDGSYTFLAAGDPQIGTTDVTTDGETWVQALAYATEWFGDTIDFLVSVGDQVNGNSSSYKEEEYEAYFQADLLSSIPSSVISGNHEASTMFEKSTYSAHFTSPDTMDDATISTIAGDESGDYWYAYEGTLFLCLNSTVTSTALHYAFIQEAIAEYTEEYGTPTWQIVTFHHSIFSSATHYADSDILTRQSTWADMFSDFDIDVVLMGHDHVYTRTVMMQGMNPTEYADNSTEEISDYVIDPNDGEVLYVTLNSSSGSKYYPIENYDLDYVAVKDQSNTPTITKVDVTNDSLTITTYYTDGDNAGAVVDEFSIIRDTTENSTDKPEVVEGETYDDIHAPKLTVPSDSTIYVGDAYDVMDGVSATDINYYYDYYYDYTEDEDPTIDLTDSIVAVGSVDTTTPGVYTVTYYVTDGVNDAADSVTVTVKEGTVLIDENTEMTATDDGYEMIFTFDGDLADYEAIVGTYITSATTTVSINNIEVASYTGATRPDETASATTQTFTLTGDDLSCIVVGENTITVTTTASDFAFISLIAEKIQADTDDEADTDADIDDEVATDEEVNTDDGVDTDEEVVIDDEIDSDTGASDSVDTGDHANVFLYTTLMLCAIVGMFAVARKKEKFVK